MEIDIPAGRLSAGRPAFMFAFYFPDNTMNVRFITCCLAFNPDLAEDVIMGPQEAGT